MKRTPPMRTRGLFELKEPFVASSSKLYEVYAIRSFRDLEERNIDVFEAFYESKGLDRSAYQDDESEQASIVTLISEDDEVIYVPDTYILSYPDMGDVKYQHVVLSVDFGALPDFLSYDHVIEQMAKAGTEIIGKEPEILTHIAPTRDAITPEDHDVLEASRRDNIENRETDYARLLQEQQRNADLQERINTLEQVIIDNNLLTDNTT